MLRKGGVLLYVTCSILPDENDAVIETFIDAHRNANPQPLAVPGIATRFGKQRFAGRASGRRVLLLQTAKRFGALTVSQCHNVTMMLRRK